MLKFHEHMALLNFLSRTTCLERFPGLQFIDLLKFCYYFSVAAYGQKDMEAHTYMYVCCVLAQAHPTMPSMPLANIQVQCVHVHVYCTHACFQTAPSVIWYNIPQGPRLNG